MSNPSEKKWKRLVTVHSLKFLQYDELFDKFEL